MNETRTVNTVSFGCEELQTLMKVANEKKKEKIPSRNEKVLRDSP